MGKCFYNNKVNRNIKQRLIAALLLFVLLLIGADTSASYGEFELFNMGYESYLSYKPEKAVEAFETFLKDFPDSSAKDAALFWLGKSFLQLKDFGMARRLFTEIKQMFPESPFIPYIYKELEILGRVDAVNETAAVPGDAKKREDTREPISVERDEKAEPAGVKVSVTAKPEEIVTGEMPPLDIGDEAKKEIIQEVKPAEAEEKAVPDEGASVIRVVEAEKKEPLVQMEEKKGEETKVAKTVEKKVEMKGLPEAAAVSKRDYIYAVQAGALKSKKAADRLKAKLEHKGYRVKIKKITSDRGSLFKIMVGEFGTKREAEGFALKLKKTMGLYAFPIEAGPQKRELKARLKEKDLKALSANIEKEQGQRKEPDKALEQSKGEREKPDNRVEENEKERETENVRKEVKEHEIAAVSIEGKRYAVQQVSELMDNALSAMTKLGVKEVLWRTGDIYEDFINELILYEEAERSGIKGDRESHKELAAKYGLTIEEEGYLERYLVISDLIGKKVENMPGKRMVESLAVNYTESDKNDKALLASELQAKAKRGMSFEDIYKAYSNAVKFAVMEFSDLQGWIKDRMESLQDGEISTVWTKDGYMILKPVVKRPSYGPFDDMQDKRGAEIRAFVRKWVEELRKEAKDIEIIKAQ